MTEIELLRKQNTEWARKLGNAAAVRNALTVLVRVCQSLDAAHDPDTGLYYAVKQAQEALKRSGNSEEVQRAIDETGGCCVGCSGDSGQPCTWYGECEA